MRPRRRRAVLVLALGLAWGACAGEARAEGGPGDGVYGRYEAPFLLALGAGGGSTWVDGTAEASMVAELRLRHVAAAGPFVAGRWAPDGGSHVVLGVEVLPLFPMLFLENLFTGRERLDRTIQSLGLELGAALLPVGEEAGLGLAVGAGAEVPLVLPSQWAQGVWLRLAFRYVHAPARWQAGPAGDASEWTALATLVVQLPVGAGDVLVEAPRDRR